MVGRAIAVGLQAPGMVGDLEENLLLQPQAQGYCGLEAQDPDFGRPVKLFRELPESAGVLDIQPPVGRSVFQRKE